MINAAHRMVIYFIAASFAARHKVTAVISLILCQRYLRFRLYQTQFEAFWGYLTDTGTKALPGLLAATRPGSNLVYDWPCGVSAGFFSQCVLVIVRGNV